MKIWDLATFEEVGAFAGHRSEIHSMDLSSDGAKMVSGSSDGRVIVWDVATLEVETEFRAHEGIIDSVELSPDGARVLTTSQFEGVTRVWKRGPELANRTACYPGSRAERFAIAGAGRDRIRSIRVVAGRGSGRRADRVVRARRPEDRPPAGFGNLDPFDRGQP